MSVPGINRDRLSAAVGALPNDPLAPVRREAAARFLTLGFPKVGEEDWKYTNLADAAALSNEWLASADAVTVPAMHGPVELEAMRAIDACWIVVRDGTVDLGDIAMDGISVRSLATSGADIECELPMSAFNAALLRDGLHVTVAAGAKSTRPLAILYADSASNVVKQTRVVVDAGPNSQLELIEYSVSTEPGRQFTNAVCELRLADGARIDHVRIQDREREHTGINRVTATVGRDAEYHHNSFDFGGALTRNDVVADIVGRGAMTSLNGLYLASGEQHIDNHTSILHRIGPTTSTEEYRGILSGRSQCVFNGKVVVFQGADGTDSQQANHNLLLSDRAEIDTKPELEIYADEVKCAHGATVGQLDTAALFYLRARGLDIDQARRILTRAFAAGTLSKLAIAACHDWLAGMIDGRLEKLVGERQ